MLGRMIALLSLLPIWVFGQPGDFPFSIVMATGAGYVGCNQATYVFYACTADYPNSQSRSGVSSEVWRPDTKTLRIRDTLTCVRSEKTEFPFEAVYMAPSCLETNVLMIVKDRKDTMFINAAGTDGYQWRIDPFGADAGLPFVFWFEKGLQHLHELHKQPTRLTTHHNAFHEHYLASKPQMHLVAQNNRITEIATDKLSYQPGDTIAVVLSGTVLNDGGCSGNRPMWTLQKKESGEWRTEVEHCCIQMSCGKGPTLADHSFFPLFLHLSDRHPGPLFVQQVNSGRGTYRLVVYDDLFAPYWTEEFYLE